MSTVASVNYLERRIYLSATTVGAPLDTLDVYRDVRSLRRTIEAHRKFRPLIIQGGNIRKTEATATQPYAQLLNGCRIVPYDVKHSLKVVRDTFTDDGLSGIECFDRSSLTSEVDIDYAVDKVEVQMVSTSGPAFTLEDIITGVAQETMLKPIDGKTTEELLRLMAAVLLGKVSGASSGTEIFRSITDTKNRVVATVDENGNRTEVLLDAS